MSRGILVVFIRIQISDTLTLCRHHHYLQTSFSDTVSLGQDWQPSIFSDFFFEKKNNFGPCVVTIFFCSVTDVRGSPMSYANAGKDGWAYRRK